jgi:hypothetical protein
MSARASQGRFAFAPVKRDNNREAREQAAIVSYIRAVAIDDVRRVFAIWGIETREAANG